VCGSRNWTDTDAISVALGWFADVPNVLVIHGDARGADRLAGAVAKEMGFDVRPFPADWNRHGNGAGPIRNQQMLDEGHPDIVLAFPLGMSRGTRDMIRRARKAGIRTHILGTT
jgi:hypothetical protein